MNFKIHGIKLLVFRKIFISVIFLQLTTSVTSKVDDFNSSSFVTVNTEYGPVKGIIKSSLLGRNYASFQGIPYMKAPMGKLRFRDAQPPEKWTTEFDGTKLPPRYKQFNMYAQKLEGQEDAGVINVYTPYIAPKTFLPVMIFIHSGGFQEGSGGPDFYGPDYFMQKDVVLVTFNYRLGVVGFLSLQDPKLNIPGNAGLKDQVFALKWVQRNIESFGGNREEVTLFGQSAGGASAHLHMISDQSKNLFKRAILMSGVAFNQWAFVPHSNWAERLALQMNWSGGNETELLEFLESSEPFDFVKAEKKMLTANEVYGLHVIFPFGPTVEPAWSFNNFIPKSPVLMARDAWSKDIDCIIGAASFEGLFDAHITELDDGALNAVKSSVAFFAPLNELQLNETTEEAARYGRKIKEIYYGDAEPSKANMELYHQFHSDLQTLHGNYRAIKSRLNSGGVGKTYSYRFDADTELNTAKIMIAKKADTPGATHSDDICYLFSSIYVKTPRIGSIEFGLIKKMIELWTSFAIFDSPKLWSEVLESNGPYNCLNIMNFTMEMIEMPEYSRLEVWNEVYEDAGVALC